MSILQGHGTGPPRIGSGSQRGSPTRCIRIPRRTGSEDPDSPWREWRRRESRSGRCASGTGLRDRLGNERRTHTSELASLVVHASRDARRPPAMTQARPALHRSGLRDLRRWPLLVVERQGHVILAQAGIQGRHKANRVLRHSVASVRRGATNYPSRRGATNYPSRRGATNDPRHSRAGGNPENPATGNSCSVTAGTPPR